MDKIGVIGAGVMGTGVAHLFAQHNYSVTVVDCSTTQLSRSEKLIRERVRYYKLSGFSDFSGHPQKVIDNIQFTTALAPLKDVDFLIENITENWNKKQALYQELTRTCSQECLFAVNTSAIPITKVASMVTSPQRVIGLHFMNPVVLMPMVEMICAEHTSAAVIEKTQALLSTVNKKHILVKDAPGFVTNRAMMIFINEAIFMLQEQVAKAEDIDTLFRQCFGHKMGPLQTADLIGLDTILYSLDVLYEEFNDPKYRPCWLLKKLVASGRKGEKSGQGFYTYHHNMKEEKACVTSTD